MAKTDNFKVGDKVLVSESCGWHDRRHKPGTVTRKTPTGITIVMVDAYDPHGTIAHEVRFKSNGWEVGNDTYRGREIERYNGNILAEESEKIRIGKMREALNEMRWRKVISDAVIEQIWAIVEPELK